MGRITFIVDILVVSKHNIFQLHEVDDYVLGIIELLSSV